MDEFGYLAVILSIILGLSVTQLLQGLSQVINGRDRVRIYWPAIGWTLLLLVIDVQAWWAMFGYRNRHAWTFLQFAVLLLETIILYLLAVLALPTPFGEETVDLRQLFPPRPLVFRLVRDRSSGQSHEECCNDRFLAGTSRSGFSFILDRRGHHRSRDVQRSVPQGICLRQCGFVRGLHCRTLF